MWRDRQGNMGKRGKSQRQNLTLTYFLIIKKYVSTDTAAFFASQGNNKGQINSLSDRMQRYEFVC